MKLSKRISAAILTATMLASIPVINVSAADATQSKTKPAVTAVSTLPAIAPNATAPIAKTYNMLSKLASLKSADFTVIASDKIDKTKSQSVKGYYKLGKDVKDSVFYTVTTKSDGSAEEKASYKGIDHNGASIDDIAGQPSFILPYEPNSLIRNSKLDIKAALTGYAKFFNAFELAENDKLDPAKAIDETFSMANAFILKAAGDKKLSDKFIKNVKITGNTTEYTLDVYNFEEAAYKYVKANIAKYPTLKVIWEKREKERVENGTPEPFSGSAAVSKSESDKIKVSVTSTDKGNPKNLTFIVGNQTVSVTISNPNNVKLTDAEIKKLKELTKPRPAQSVKP